MSIKIVSRWNSETVLFEGPEELPTIKEVLELVVRNGADLYEADLRRADLYEADLRRADLRGADLYEADLRRADLRGADLYEADLRGADLRGADLYEANLGGANLRGADLYEANLGGANLRRANLRGAKLSWNDHTLLSEILKRSAGDDIERRKIAGLIQISTDWCWNKFLALKSDSLFDWAIDTLAACVVDGDDSPKLIRDRAAALKPETV